MAGDRLLYADGYPLFGDSIDKDSITSRLKGKRNTKVSLNIYRRGVQELFAFDILRKEVPLASIDASYKLEDKLGYIKLNRFSETTYDEFMISLNNLIDKGITGLVLDLRDNPGGYIFTAKKMIDEFLKEGQLILITKNKNGKEDKTYSTGKGEFEDGRVYILINQNTASASEIIAGALQDNDRGIIVGRRSYGKGLVQKEMAIGDGSAVRLTIAKYYTQTGRSIQKPYGEGNDIYYQDYKNRYHSGEMVTQDSIKVVYSLRFVTPK